MQKHQEVKDNRNLESRKLQSKAEIRLKKLLKWQCCAIDGADLIGVTCIGENSSKLALMASTDSELSMIILEFKQPKVNEYGLRDANVLPITGCDKESDNSKENTDDSLKQQQKTDASLVKSSLKVDKDWKEKFFCPANQVREEEPMKARENNDAPIIEDWVSDDEEEVESIPKVEKKTAIPTATKKELVKTENQLDGPLEEPKRVSKALSDPAWVEATSGEVVSSSRARKAFASSNSRKSLSPNGVKLFLAPFIHFFLDGNRNDALGIGVSIGEHLLALDYETEFETTGVLPEESQTEVEQY
ncbi:hypothetical protein Tco_0566870 [Tanacetum coccineum]